MKPLRHEKSPEHLTIQKIHHHRPHHGHRGFAGTAPFLRRASRSLRDDDVAQLGGAGVSAPAACAAPCFAPLHLMLGGAKLYGWQTDTRAIAD